MAQPPTATATATTTRRLTPLQVLLHRRGAVYLPDTGRRDLNPATAPGVTLLEADLLARGWMLSPALYDALSRVDPTELVLVGTTLLANCDELIGADVRHVPLFRGFPDHTPPDTLALLVERVLAAWLQAPDQPCVLCENTDTVAPVNPCGHLVCRACFDGANYTACPICHRRITAGDPFLRPAPARAPAPAGTPLRLRVLHLRVGAAAANEDLDEELRALLGRPTALPPADVQDLQALLDSQLAGASCGRLGWVPLQVPGRETKARLVGWLLTWCLQTPDCLPILGRLLDSPTDVLRAVVVLSGGEPSLIAAPRLRTLRRPVRRILLSALQDSAERQGLPAVLEEMRRRARLWVRAGQTLHPGDYAGRHPHVALAFAALRRTDLYIHPDGPWLAELAATIPAAAVIGGRRITAASLGAQVEASLAAGDAAAAAALLARARPGELVRRLDHLLRLTAGRYPGAPARSRVFAALQSCVEQVAPAVLLAASGHLRTRVEARPLRVVFPATRSSVAHVLRDERPPLPYVDAAQATALIAEELLRRAASLPPLDVAVIDADLRGLLVPYAQRNAAKTLVDVARGSVLPLGTADYLRLFCHWTQGPEQRVDLDLSIAFYDGAWNYLDTCAYTGLRTLGAVHSGDRTDAPAPAGASEFIDLPLRDMLPDRRHIQHVRYAAVVILSYTGVPFNQIPEAFAGWMLRCGPPQAGEIFQARDVEQRFDLRAATRTAMPLVVDLATATATWLDVAPRVTGDTDLAVWSHERRFGRTARTMMQHFTPGPLGGPRIALGELAYLHAAARAGEVLIRRDGTVAGFHRRPGESPAVFASRLHAHRDPDTPPADAARTAELAAGRVGLYALTRADVPIPDGSQLYALYPAGADASKVTMLTGADLAAQLAPAQHR